jgi:hypothetical protein
MKQRHLSLAAALFAALAGVASAAEMQATWGLGTLNRIARDPRNVIVAIHSCRLDGFQDDRSPYRAPSVRRTAEGGRIVATVKAQGTYYPGFVIYDTAGDERFSIRIDGVERGVAVANSDDNRQRLFFLSEPYTFRGGETVELKALTASGIYRTEDIYLLAEKPSPRRHEYLFTDIEARYTVSGAAAAATLTWITNWPTAATVEYRTSSAVPIHRVKEDAAVQNHRVALSGLRAGGTYHYRIAAVDREGRAVASEWKTFSTAPQPAVAGSVAKQVLPLHIVNPLDAAEQPARFAGVFPATAGIPFPKGALGSDRNVRLLDPSGKETPLQTETMAHWDDGSVKWMLADFQAGAKSTGGYTLEYGNAVRRAAVPTPLRVIEGPAGVTVTTGPLQFTVSKRRLGLFHSLLVDANRNGAFEESEHIVSPARPCSIELIGEDGAIYTTLAAPGEVLVEENGPQRAVIRATGEHRAKDGRALFAYTIRIHAYAGQPFLRIQYTFGYNRGESEFASIRGLALKLNLTGVGTHWSLGAGAQGDFGASGSIELRQPGDDRYTVSSGARGTHAEGFAEWSDAKRTVTLAVHDFWQNYPKGLKVTNDGIELGLCPRLPPDEYTAFKGTTDEYKLYYYLLDGRYKFRQGASKTHDIWIEFAASGAAPAAVRMQRSVLRALAPPAWYSTTKVFGELAAPSTTGLLAQYDAAFRAGFSQYMRDRASERAYGMLNFGDWYGERVINWGNGEYDTQKALLVQFARTGDVRYFLPGEEMEWHNRDVDTIQYHRDPTRVGGVYHHAIGHTGGYYSVTPIPGQGIAPGILTVDHVYTEGHLAYYFLTGDRYSMETARKIAGRYGTWDTRNYDFFDSRVAGWHLLLTTAVYKATLDPFYLNAAKIIIERVLERQTPNGGWDRWPICAHADEPPHAGELSYMVGVLLTGMTRYHEVTGDARVAASVTRGVRYLMNDAWVPELRGFRYATCPRALPTPGQDPLNFLVLSGVALAHRETGEPKFRMVLIEATQKALASLLHMGETPGERALGKMLGLFTSPTPHVIGYVAALVESKE